MNQQELSTFEQLCSQVFGGDNKARQEAENLLQGFQTLAYIPKCQFILENSISPFALLYSAQAFKKAIEANWQSLMNTPRSVELRSWILMLLGKKAADFSNYVQGALVQLTCSLIKYSLLEESQKKDLTEILAHFFQASIAHYLIGLQIYNRFVPEMSQTMGHSITQQRKTALSFRDKSLLNVATLGFLTLRKLHNRKLIVSDANQADQLRQQALELIFQCLSFDFLSVAPDESSEEAGTCQLPNSWRSLVSPDGVRDENSMSGVPNEGSNMKLLFEIYSTSSPAAAQKAMQCLTLFGSIRRSLFPTEPEKDAFLNEFLIGITNIIRNNTGLREVALHHECCRMLARLKSNYQLVTLLSAEAFKDWIAIVSNFSVSTMQAWQWAPNSVFYLLTFWSRLIAATAYIRHDHIPLLEKNVQQVMEAYVKSRMDAAAAIVSSDEIEDPLEDDQLKEILDLFPYLTRLAYKQSVLFVTSLFEKVIANLQQTLSQTNPSEDNVTILFGQLAWLVYLFGSMIAGRMLLGYSEESDKLDGELSAHIFRLANFIDNCPQQFVSIIPYEHLQMAILYFLQQFRKMYVGEQASNAIKVYAAISDLLGSCTQTTVIELVVRKIIANLKLWSAKRVVESTLSLFNDLASSYSSNKLLGAQEITQELLYNHLGQQFKFLETVEDHKNITQFYSTLGKMVFYCDDSEKFDRFTSSLSQVLELLLTFNTIESFRQPEAKNAILLMVRNLTGISAACMNKRGYGMLFEWLYPKFFPIFHRALSALHDNSDFAAALLRFFCELTCNKIGRLNFEISSANSILLFREVSNVIVTYGNAALAMTVVSDPYKERLRGIGLCLTMMTNVLIGNYLNFGVFALYGDPSYPDAINTCLKLAISLPFVDILSYKKVSQAWFAFIDALCNVQPEIIAKLDPSLFDKIILTVKEGLQSIDSSIVLECCSLVDHIAEFFFHKTTKSKDPNLARMYCEQLRNVSRTFSSLLIVLMDMLLTENCSYQWSVSRPLLSLITLFPEDFKSLTQQLIMSRPQNQQQLTEAITALMDGITGDLQPRNRDRFSQNLNRFCTEVKTIFRTTNQPQN
eukprot:TRINITY_DN1158_c3_g1_i1.p1 TRINITY_DN1158_c3_g1~~TRINITY_DN1158_c3_g1_i1.p1  ORF type:complete len:1079 (-),score=426.68 TRINITY_DN1158_c3_g1_i1:10-3246(-)